MPTTKNNWWITTSYRWLLTVLVWVIFLSQLISPVIAAENFSTSLKTSYIVYDSGQTKITHQLTITNNKPLYTITQYGLKVTSPGITSVQAVNQAGQPLPAEVVTTNNQTSIGITFPDQLVGEGKV